MNRESLEFLGSLHEEKLKHKQHRVDFVKQKLLFTIGLFSIGSLKIIQVGGQSVVMSDLLLFVPIVALAFDIFIFSEDFKVKRIGIFIFEKCHPTIEEKRWEDWLSLPKHRERSALIASAMLTIIVLIACLLMLHSFAMSRPVGVIRWLSKDTSIIYWWFILCSVSIALVLEATTYLRDDLVNPWRNRLGTSMLYLGILFILLLPAGLAFLEHDTVENFQHLYDSPYLTLFCGAVVAVWLIVAQRVRREIRWRRSGKFSLVKFEVSLDKDRVVRDVYLCGDFTKWEVNAIKMAPACGVDDASSAKFACKIALESGKTYQYKYLTIDQDNMEYWVFDAEDGKVQNDDGDYNSERKIQYTRYDQLHGIKKFVRDLYS